MGRSLREALHIRRKSRDRFDPPASQKRDVEKLWQRLHTAASAFNILLSDDIGIKRYFAPLIHGFLTAPSPETLWFSAASVR